jgi:hypothetical protein
MAQGNLYPATSYNGATSVQTRYDSQGKATTAATNPQSQHYQSRPLCNHKGPHWRIGEATIVADRIHQIERKHGLALIIDCSDEKPTYAEPAPRLVLPPGYESLTQFEYPEVPVIAVPWADYGAPELAPGFWTELVRLLPAGMVGVGCVGGHGRTGTALACLRIAGLKESASVAFETVRREYCEDAVESAAQVEYIREVGVALRTTPLCEPTPDARRETPRFVTIGEELAAKRELASTQGGDARPYELWKRDQQTRSGGSTSPQQLAQAALLRERTSKLSKRELKRQKREQRLKAGLE